MPSCYTRVFTDSELEQLKEAALEKQTILAKKYGAYNNLTIEAPNRWIGDTGEIAIKEMLTEYYGWVDGLHFTHHTSNIERDEQDFTISAAKTPLLMDVKTQTANVIPQDDYLVNVNAAQMTKIRALKKINCLAFCSLYIPTHTIYVHGWLTVPEYEKKMKFLKKGDTSGKITINSPVYCVKMSDLRAFQRKI